MNPTAEAKINTPNWPVRIEIDPRVYTDKLTGIRNREWLDKNLPEIIKEKPGETALMMVDLDDFKSINDTHGHDAGDVYLQKAANVLDTNTRDREDEGDTIRYGGDEFMVILRDVHNEENLRMITDRVQSGLEEKGIKASIGSFMHEGEDAAEFIKKVDIAMYEDKKERKNKNFKELPRRKRIAAKLGKKFLHYAGMNPPR